ncbi:MAG: S49 family peptidase, partial [Acidobacteria bacterium]
MASEGNPVLRVLGQVVLAFIGFFALMFFLGLFVLGLGAGIGAALGAGGEAVDGEGPYVHVSGEKGSADRLLKITVEGLILGSPPREGDFYWDAFADVTYGYAVQDALRAAAEDDAIKGVLLHLRTPGGTIFGSRAIHDGVMAFRRSERPVVAWIEGLSASGGVMAMVGADAIYADHGSFVGSIGVIGPVLTYFDQPVATEGGILGGGVVTRDGIEQIIVHAGRGKDLGNPFRRPTAEELANLQAGLDHEYDAFVAHVAEHRHIEPEAIRQAMGAQIFDNATAEGYGLIDGTRSRDEALAALAELAGVAESYQLVRPRKHATSFWQLMSARLGLAPGLP